MARRVVGVEIVDDNFGRSEHVLAAPIAALEDFEHDAVGLGRDVARANGLVAERVKGLAEVLFGFDAVVSQDLVQLLEGHLNALAELFVRSGNVTRCVTIASDTGRFNERSFICAIAASCCAPRKMKKAMKMSMGVMNSPTKPNTNASACPIQAAIWVARL